MESDEKRTSGVAKSEIRCSVDGDAEALERLRRLREKLLSDDISTARVAGFHLSWLQEDGLAILKEVLFGNYATTPKKAAAYGVRSMHGRMKKMAVEVLRQGLEHRDQITKDACIKSLALMEGKVDKKSGSDRRSDSGKYRIKDLRGKKGPRTRSPRRKRPSGR